MNKSISYLLSCFIVINLHAQNNASVFRNMQQPIDPRVNDLLHQLTLQEKISLLGYRSKEVERLGIPAYNWWNEALHGVARAGVTTVIPQAIGKAATFNYNPIFKAAEVIPTEAGAK